MKRRVLTLTLLALLPVVGVIPAGAQDVPPPAHIAVVEGAAVLLRDDHPEPAPVSMPILSGDRLRTDDGRVEVMLSDGATVQVDASTTVDFQSDDLIRLIEGRIRLSIPGPDRAVSYRIDTPAGWVEIGQPGEYRVALTPRSGRDEIELAVVRGAADLFTSGGQTALRTGERAYGSPEAAPSQRYVFNSAAWDGFDRWSEQLRSDRRGVSAQYLPDPVRPYASTFDDYGAWRYEATYGYVWYPSVGIGWRPYFNGRWASFPTFGWTWIGTDAWSWPTHHYGRWGVSAGSWYWIPGRTWGPAWVSWAYAPGYVSWCPLGWDNRPAVQFAGGGYNGGRYDPWSAWTIVPHQRFGAGFVNASVVAGLRLDTRTRGAFVVRPIAPEIRGQAVARSAAPIDGSGVRRGSPGAYAADRSRPWASGAPGTPGGNGGSIRATGPDANTQAAAAFRSRRPEMPSDRAALPAPSRTPGAPVSGFGARSGAAAGTPSRPLDPAGPGNDRVPTYRAGVAGGPSSLGVSRDPPRGTVVREPRRPTDDGGSGYRGITPGPAERQEGRDRPAAIGRPGYPGTRPVGPAATVAPAPSWPAPGTQPPRAYGAAPRSSLPFHPYSGSASPTAPPPDPRGRAVPRQALDAPPPSYRGGGGERRASPPPPPSSEAAPAPRSASPRAAPASGAQSRPSTPSPAAGAARRR